MESDFRGYLVEIQTDILKTVRGLVKFYDDNSIVLEDVIVNDQKVPDQTVSLERQSISSIKVISSPQTPKEIPKTPSSRDLRRQKLQNIPGAFSAYVASTSPPRVAKTTQRAKNSKPINSSNHSFSAEGSNYLGSWNKRSASFDTLNRSSPGTESDSAASRKSKKRGNRKKSGSRNRSSNGWDSLQVEDFLNDDFDFEGNLKLFDKKAFYEETDAKEARGSRSSKNDGRLRNLIPDEEQVLVEGPDGIRFQPITSTPTKCLTPSSELSNGVTKSESPISSLTLSEQSKTTSKSSSSPCSKCWVTQTGQKVPRVNPSVYKRLLEYLVTGRDCEGVVPTLPIGLGWSRLIEMTGYTVVNRAIPFLKQSTISQHTTHSASSHRPHHQQQHCPLRVLVLPGYGNLGGTVAVNVARHLAVRGSACVLLHSSIPNSRQQQQQNGSTAATPSPDYATELKLARTLASRSTAVMYSTDGGDFVSEAGGETPDFDDSDSEGPLEGGSVSGSGSSSSSSRMWVSRIPGISVVSKLTSVIHHSPSTSIDLLVLGQPLLDYSPRMRQWLLKQKSIRLTVQLGSMGGELMPTDSLAPAQSECTWLVQAGIPVASANEVLPKGVEVQLVDVGMSRPIVSRVTGDLRALPPPFLFDMAPCVTLVREESRR